jgi:hypothetical protein
VKWALPPLTTENARSSGGSAKDSVRRAHEVRPSPAGEFDDGRVRSLGGPDLGRSRILLAAPEIRPRLLCQVFVS